MGHGATTSDDISAWTASVFQLVVMECSGLTQRRTTVGAAEAMDLHVKR